MKVPERISITVAANGAPLQGVPAMLSFLMKQKNHHGFVFGPSDDSGTIRVSGDEIRREARKTMELFLMDYADIDIPWIGKLRVIPMNREALNGALSAFRQFRNYEFPPKYEEMLVRADEVLSGLSSARIDCTVHYESVEPITVEIIAVHAE